MPAPRGAPGVFAGDLPYPTGAVPGWAGAPVQGRRKVVRDVRSRHIVRRLHLWSVFKVSVIFYTCVLAVLLVAGALLWDVASAAGVIHAINKSVRSLFALSSFQLHPLTALGWGAAVMGGLCVIGVFVNVLAAMLYNLISDIVGGVEVTLVDDQQPWGPSAPAAPGRRGAPAGRGPAEA